jgi:uncharacterized OB-fold protein
MSAKPSPQPTEETEPFWSACRDQRLAYQACTACSRAQFPPGSICRHCHADRLEWRPASGSGTVHTFSVVHRAPTAVFASDVPYVLALVDMAEGFRMMGNVVGCEPGDVHVAGRVEVIFEARGEHMRIPQFRLA